MKHTGTTCRLLQGSHNIDIMRQEVIRLVSLLVGYRTGLERPGLATPRYPAESCEWVITDHVNGLVIECHNSEGVKLFSSEPSSKFSTENVQVVWQALPKLVDGIRNSFPKISEKWKPLINASLLSD
jgi:hypothetical protein